jgi:SNF2 family DNA or RNA helicase
LEQDIQEIIRPSGSGAKKKVRLKLGPGQVPSSKMMKVLEILEGIRDSGEEKRKTVVFSQFTEMLDLMEDLLKEKGFKMVRIDGR